MLEPFRVQFSRLIFFYSSATNNYTRKTTTLWRSANTGYYLTGLHSNKITWYNIKPCTNPYPSNAHYSGPGTPDNADGTIVDANDCPWECDAGYGHTAADTCEPLCTAGITQMKTSNGLSYNIYAEKQTTSAINVLHNNTVCYISLTIGHTTGAIHIKIGDTIYHATN